jgi:hypothetical protein
MHFINGALKREGAGLSFFYFAPSSTLVDIPINSVEVPFIFQELTSDFQPIALTGQLTYRVSNPVQLAQLLDFSVDEKGEYVNAKDPRDLLAQRLTNLALINAKSITQRLTLHEALAACDSIGLDLYNRLRTDTSLQLLGVEILSLALLSVKTTPETAKALEAGAREALLRQADQAIYARRNAAVEQERQIKESELNTEIAVENKRREIRETKMRADIALEEQRSVLIEKTVENERKHADSKAYALRATLEPLQNTNWKTLLAASSKNGDPRLAISMAFEELAENAGRIGQLNVTPDLLKALLPEATCVSETRR